MTNIDGFGCMHGDCMAFELEGQQEIEGRMQVCIRNSRGEYCCLRYDKYKK